MLVVFRFWILFIMMMFGFCCRNDFSVVVKVSFVLLFMLIWLMLGNWIFVGFLVVEMLMLFWFSLFRNVYSDIVLFELVGFVMSIMLYGCLIMLSSNCFCFGL